MKLPPKRWSGRTVVEGELGAPGFLYILFRRRARNSRRHRLGRLLAIALWALLLAILTGYLLIAG